MAFTFLTGQLPSQISEEGIHIRKDINGRHVRLEEFFWLRGAGEALYDVHRITRVTCNASAAQRAASAVRWSRLVGRTKVSCSRVYGYGFTALPCSIIQRTCRLAIEDLRGPRLAPLATKAPLGSTRFPAP